MAGRPNFIWSSSILFSMKLKKNGPVVLIFLGTVTLLVTALLGMDDPVYYRIGVLLSGLGVFSLLLANASLSDPGNAERGRDTQGVIGDLKLLRLFERQPGGLLSKEMVAEKTGLTQEEARMRLNSLNVGGLLRAGSNPTGARRFFQLSAPLEEIPKLQLSGESYLTIEDLQDIFIAYNYKVSPQKLMVTTGLPWQTLSRELKHFRIQGIIDVVYIDRPGDSYKQYVLMEAYHRSDKLDLASRTRLNETVRQVLFDERYLV
jgi:DNA-binding transcriptional ArsR family regulator